MTLNTIYNFLTHFPSIHAFQTEFETPAPQATTDEKVSAVVLKQPSDWETFLQSPIDAFLAVCEHLTFKDITTLNLVSRGTRNFISDNLEEISRYFGPAVAKVKKVPLIETEGYFGSLKNYCEFTDIINIIKSEQPLPDDIRNIVDDPDSFSLDKLKHLKEYCKARDVVYVWRQLELRIGNSSSELRTIDYSSSKSIIKTAAGFSRWFSDNREALSQVRLFSLTSQNLQTLPLEIGHLSNLREIHLQSNKLSALPPEIGRLSKLTSLYLSENRLKVLPPEFGNLSNLTMLSLNDNRLSSLPSEIGRLSNLKWLFLGQNQFQNFPIKTCSLSNLADLICLGLNNNQIQTVPSEICKLLELVHLNLADNQLQTVPREIANLPKLKILNLKGNPSIDTSFKLPGIIDGLEENRTAKFIDRFYEE